MSAVELERLSKEFTSEQQAQQELMQARQKLETQYQENLGVKQEFESIDKTNEEDGEESPVYKLVGPVLLKQDFTEAKMNVDKRIEFIVGEVKRVEDQITKKNKTLEELRNKIIQVRTAAVSAASGNTN